MTMSTELWWNNDWRDNWCTQRKTCRSAASCTTNSIWTALGMNLCLYDNKPATKCPSYSTAFKYGCQAMHCVIWCFPCWKGILLLSLFKFSSVISLSTDTFNIIHCKPAEHSRNDATATASSCLQNMSHMTQRANACRISSIWGSHGSEYGDGCLLGCCAVWSRRSLLTFQRSLLPLLSPWWWRQQALLKCW
jgi:hypothetical protein